MIYVVTDLVRMVAYRYTLEHILVINVMHVVKDLVRMVAYRTTLKHIDTYKLYIHVHVVY